MLGGVRDRVEVSHHVVEGMRLLDLLQPERGLDLEGYFEDEAGAAEPADRREEQIRVLLARAARARSVCEEQDEGLHVHREDGVLHAGAVGGGGDDAAEGLVGDGAEVAHGEAMAGELVVEDAEDDAGLGDDEVLFGVDLWGRAR